MARLLPCLTALALALGLAGCSNGPHLSAQERRVLEREVPPHGDPGQIALIDIRFSRAAKDEGQWTAYRKFAASGAQLPGPRGPVDAKAWLGSKGNPATPISWTPRAVWASCDGSLAVSEGQYKRPDGMVGTYVTIWQLQKRRDYKWIYHLAAINHPQPRKQGKADLAAPSGSIVVTGVSAISGKVADCPNAPHERTAGQTQAPPPPPAPHFATDVLHGGGVSTDRTLEWHWLHRPDGTAQVTVRYLRHGRWKQVVDLSRPAAG